MPPLRASDVYTQLPLQMNPETKDISLPPSYSSPELSALIATLNSTHRLLKQPPCVDSIPPPPVPVDPKRSSAIEKMRNTGNNAFRQQKYDDAIRMYSMGLSMAQTRPGWEPAPLLREELQQLFNNRAQAHMGRNNWPEALADAEVSAEFKKQGNNKAYWRRARCLREMGRLKEAREALELGLEWGEDKELSDLLKEVKEEIKRKGE